MRKNYDELEALQNVYLEDSFVLGFSITQNLVSIDIDAVLTDSHPEFKPPIPGEQYCYLRGRLVFEGFDHAVFDFHSSSRSTDASGEVDYGNIDTFVIEENKSIILGDWGRLEINSGEIRFELEP